MENQNAIVAAVVLDNKQIVYILREPIGQLQMAIRYISSFIIRVQRRPFFSALLSCILAFFSQIILKSHKYLFNHSVKRMNVHGSSRSVVRMMEYQPLALLRCIHSTKTIQVVLAMSEIWTHRRRGTRHGKKVHMKLLGKLRNWMYFVSVSQIVRFAKLTQ